MKGYPLTSCLLGAEAELIGAKDIGGRADSDWRDRADSDQRDIPELKTSAAERSFGYR